MQKNHESLHTKLIEFNPEWIDSNGLMINAYDWACANLQPGHRVIGSRALSFNGKLDIYKFDIRHSRTQGVTVECEIPARCRTVIRINDRQMIVQESDSGEIVQKYLLFCDGDKKVWRQWHVREYHYYVERALPAVNFNIFILQCDRAVRDLAERVDRNWLRDIKNKMRLADLRADTPEAIKPLLAYLNDEVGKLVFRNMAKAEMLSAYCDILEVSILKIIQAEAGSIAPR